MKPLFILLFALASYTTGFAIENPTTPNAKVSNTVLKSFKSAFSEAAEVEWSENGSLYKASFTLHGQHVTAFYEGNGALVALTRNISSVQLPVSLQSSLKKNYSEFWITDLFEVSNDEGTEYYVTLEDNDTKLVLRTSLGSNWSTYQKSRKA